MFSAGVSGCITARAMVRCRLSKLIRKLPSCERASYCAGQYALGEEAIGLQSFVMNFAEGGNTVIPFEQSGGVADALHGAIIQFPDRIDDRMIVSIENIFFVFGMAGDMNLGDAFGGHAIHVVKRIEAVILG